MSRCRHPLGDDGGRWLWRGRTVFLLCAWLLVGCTGEVGAGADAATAPTWTVGCGRQVGDTVCDVALLGYDHPTSLVPPQHPAFALELSLRTLVQQAPRSRVLLLLGSSWCTSCQAATAMAVAHFDEISAQITVINVLIEGDTPLQPSRKSHIDAWRKTFKMPFSVVADGFETPMDARDKLGFREAAILVDRDSGLVVAREATLAALWPQLK